ncbi:DNA alkylation repair protein [Neobacillus notoginsengisoli]|uniref:DNA alkylation repair protein n=2 Tax=Neobacillus notoginsengisoli TaxID=1578198 RepID=A0A417YTQ9_9BACI|nr:DNA alkylation repair protein [Neobacillus notoginsengisoli]RHW40442.1 DNA alkylation repair protein [Neobacillus notoginsengisoli]
MDYVSVLKALFEEQRNTENAVAMEKYMKNHFPFLGVKKPLRAELERKFFATTGLVKEPFQESFVRELWAAHEREYQYVALGYLEKFSKKLEAGSLSLLKELITTKSWWDTVDALAQKPVGVLAAKYPDTIPAEMDKWAVSDNMWLRRTAILYQLKYKKETDEQRLYENIRLNTSSKEFFIQKAIGWALREYSKTNPGSVKDFIERTELAALSRREGSKYLS